MVGCENRTRTGIYDSPGSTLGMTTLRLYGSNLDGSDAIRSIDRIGFSFCERREGRGASPDKDATSRLGGRWGPPGADFRAAQP